MAFKKRGWSQKRIADHLGKHKQFVNKVLKEHEKAISGLAATLARGDDRSLKSGQIRRLKQQKNDGSGQSNAGTKRSQKPA